LSGIKHDTNKPRWDLFPWDAGEEVVKVLNFGATKYEDRNWEKGIKYGRVFGATVRHLWSWFHSRLKGEDGTDPETGLSHLAHAGCCVLFLLAYELRGKEEWDDRPLQVSGEFLKAAGVEAQTLVTAGEAPLLRGVVKKSECLCAGVRPLKDGEDMAICSTCLGVRPAVTCKGGGCK
jgi:hypothetical protein